jgi:molybdopterin molybdotransferase
MSLSLSEARAAVLAEVTRARSRATLARETVPLAEALGRVLAADVRADRDQPPFPRSTRDGFAVRAADLGAALGAGGAGLRVIGEVAAGATFTGTVAPGTAVEIMTGAPVPDGADAVLMVEHVERASDRIVPTRTLVVGENIVPRGSELAAGAVACAAGHRLDAASIALLASLGCARPEVYARPRVAIVGTGDELVGIDETPGLAQIRDSNRYCLAALVARAGGEPVPLPIARDDRGIIERALADAAAKADIVLVTGGVSMGKYDHVEAALGALSARVIFESVAIRPGKPLVFGLLGDKAFFGLPGNPLSALVTFELFGRAAVELWSGCRAAAPLGFFAAKLAAAYTQRALPLTVFAPATFTPDPQAAFVSAPSVAPVRSQGSGDLAAMAAADGFLVVEPGVTSIAAGDWVTVLPK